MGYKSHGIVIMMCCVSGSDTMNGILKGLLGNSMFLGGLVAFILDNTVRGRLVLLHNNFYTGQYCQR